jgi:hypothetical protein
MRRVRVLKDFNVTTNPNAPRSRRIWRAYKAGTVVDVLESQYDRLLSDGKIADEDVEKKEVKRGRWQAS